MRLARQPQMSLRRLTLAIYTRGAEIARERGVIIADTKFEFGRDASGKLILADEVLTPDSSRFWKVSEYEPGRPQWSYDKQYLRDWSSSLGDGIARTQDHRFRRMWSPRHGPAMWRSLSSSRARSGVRELSRRLESATI